MKSNIPSTRRLLKFVFKNPNCSAEDVAHKFQIEHMDAVCILNGVSDCIVSKFVTQDGFIVDRSDIQLTAVGRQYLEDKSWDRLLVTASFLVSLASLIVAVIAACISYQTNTASPDNSSATTENTNARNDINFDSPSS